MKIRQEQERSEWGREWKMLRFVTSMQTLHLRLPALVPMMWLLILHALLPHV